MSNVYNIDWRQFVFDFLPIRLRNDVNIDFLLALLAPLIFVYGKLRVLKNEQMFMAGRQQHIAHIEGLLNDRFDAGFRRIRIVDAPEDFEPFELFQEVENKPVYFHQELEIQAPQTLWDYEESEFGGVDFIVEIPFSVATDRRQELAAFLNKHKGPGASVIIQDI